MVHLGVIRSRSFHSTVQLFNCLIVRVFYYCICLQPLRISLFLSLLYAELFLCTHLFSQSTPFEHFTSGDGLPGNSVYDVAQTSDGSLWFATDKGMARYNGIAFTIFGNKEGLQEQEITQLFIDKTGKLWCCSASGNFSYYENNVFNPLPVNGNLSQFLANKILNDFSVDADGALWISTVTAGKPLRVTSQSVEEISLSTKINFSFFAMFTGDSNLIAGSYKSAEPGNKLCVFPEEKPFIITLSEKGGYTRSSFLKRRDGSFLYAKGYELVHFRTGTIISRKFVEKNIESILEDSENKIWVALYQGGVICYPPSGDKLSSGIAVSYLGDKTVTSLLEDKAGNFWFTTNEDGVYYLPAKLGLSYAPPKMFSDNRMNETESVLGLSSGANQVQLSSQPDFRVISTDTLRYDTVPPVIYISGVRINGHDTMILAHYELPYNYNFIKINFAGFVLNNPEALQYKYYLDGVDKEWLYTGNTFAQYTTLPPGKYIFRVNAMNKSGYWSDAPVKLTFTIHPPFWQTWWFIFLVIVAVLSLVSILFIARVRQIKKREREKAGISKQIIHLELQALRAQMNPHFIFNTLSSIQYFITANDSKAALRYLSKFARLMRSIMDNSRKSVVLLKDEVQALELYLELESLRFKSKLKYFITIDPSVDINYEEIPSMLIQPYIENAIVHGITHKETGGVVSVKISKRNKSLVCEIEDNGIGRQKSEEINKMRKNSHVSTSMAITENRLKLLNTLEGSPAGVIITDLHDKENCPCGTRVLIVIP